MAHNSPNLALKQPESSVIPHVVLWLVQIVALASPPFAGRRTVFAISIIGLGVYCNLHPHFTNNFDLAQPFSLAWSFYASVLVKLLISGPEGPEAHFWRIDKSKQEARAYRSLGWKKLRWAATLMFNHRGIRWIHQVKNVPSLPRISSSRFIVHQLGKACMCIVMGDLLYNLHQRVNFTASNGEVGQMNSKYMTLRHSDWRWSMMRSFSLAALPYYGLSMQFALGGCLAVLFGISKPEDWPSPFGGLSDMKSIRSFWGAFWHQQLRHMLTACTDGFAHSLGIRPGTNLSSYSKLYLAFFLSGIFHALGQLHLPRPANITAAECSLGFLHFFMWQAIAITFEDFVKWCWRKTGFSVEWVQTVSYIWVFVCLWLSFPLVGDTVLKLRIGTGEFAPFPLTKPLVLALLPIPP